MRARRSGMLFALFAFTLFFCTTCSKKSPTGPSDSTDGDFKTGATIMYQVSGSGAVSVRDTVSGAIFQFPNGGSGTLSVTPVVSGPEVGISATRVTVRYSGSGDLAISVPHTAGNEEVVYTYTKLPNVSVEGANAGDPAWLSLIPLEQRRDVTVFALFSATESTGKRVQSGTSATIAIATVDSAEARRKEARDRVAAAVAFWVNNLPPALADSARNRINHETPCRIAWSSDGNCYDHTNSTIYLQVDGDPDTRANAHTCAHEVGHYMTHILAGYDRYVEILDRMPQTWYGAPVSHGFAEYFEFRKYVVEEYAFLSDYLITGTVDTNDLAKPAVSTMFGSSGPEGKDFPSFEGFGSIMLGSLLRDKPEVYSFRWKTDGVSKAPVVHASAGEVLALTSRGARDTNELYRVIQDYLISRGYDDRDKLAAMLEPLGWSYHGSGKIVDAKGNPIAGAVVQSISRNGSGEFRPPAGAPSGTDGKFTLNRIYPGTNLLRVFSNSGKDSTTFQFTADSTRVTSTALDLGTITLTSKPMGKQLVRESSEDIKFGDKLVARVKTTLTADVTGYEIQPNSIQTVAGLDLAVGMPSTVKISVSSSIETFATDFGGVRYTYEISRISIYKNSSSSGTIQDSGAGTASYSAEFAFASSTDMIEYNTVIQLTESNKNLETGYSYTSERSVRGPSIYLYARR